MNKTRMIICSQEHLTSGGLRGIVALVALAVLGSPSAAQWRSSPRHGDLTRLPLRAILLPRCSRRRLITLVVDATTRFSGTFLNSRHALAEWSETSPGVRRGRPAR